MTNRGLGRVEPKTFEHIDKYPALRMVTGPDVCERTLPLSSRWRRVYDQGDTPRCVGYSVSQERSLSERATYDPDWLYAECKKRDGYSGPGTYLSVAYDVMREIGHRKRHAEQPDPRHGVERFEWARTITEIRHAIQAGMSVVVGTSWYRRMFVPERRHGQYWLPQGGEHLGTNEGGHAYLLHRVSDRFEAFGTPNTWGPADRLWTPGEDGWPVSLVPYSLMERLLNENGEAVLVIDREDMTR